MGNFFGSGPGTLVIFPGLGDALGSVRGKPLLLSLVYKHWGRAIEAVSATDALGLGPYCVMGISQGGMIALWLAAVRPDLVKRLVLAVATAWAGNTVRTIMDRWQAWVCPPWCLEANRMALLVPLPLLTLHSAYLAPSW